MTRTPNSLRAALLLTLTLLAGCGLGDAKQVAIRFAAGALRRSVFCLQSSVPLTQSSFKASTVATNEVSEAAATATGRVATNAAREAVTIAALRAESDRQEPAAPAPCVQRANEAPLAVRVPDFRIVTCPVERRRLLAGLLLRTL